MTRTPLALVLALSAAVTPLVAAAQDASPLHAGPMLGPVGARSAAVWVQTSRAASVQLRYHPLDRPEEARLTPALLADAAEQHALTVWLEALAPATSYAYELYLDGALVPRPYPLRFTTRRAERGDPADVTLVAGSCAYLERAPWDEADPADRAPYAIFGAMAAAAQGADAMIWLGDNVYLRRGDLDGPAGIAGRYRSDRALPELAPLLAAAPQLAIWDDHDFGPNNSDRAFAFKQAALATFARYWPAHGYGLADAPGVFRRVTLEDLDLFLLDCRYHRAPNDWPAGPDKLALGLAQLEWLKAGLASSRAAFKLIVVGNQVLNEVSPYESLRGFADTDALLAWLASARIEGVVLLSGDRHHTELLRAPREGLYPLYELTSSPLTSRVHRFDEEHPEHDNPRRVPGTLVQEHNFAVLRVHGPRADRKLALEARDRTGRVLWTHEVARRELSLD